MNLNPAEYLKLIGGFCCCLRVQVRIMEQQLNEQQWTPSETTSQQLNSFQHTMVAKERDINRLETQVDEQKKLRLNDAKQVEAKAAKIKEWVTNKLREVTPIAQSNYSTTLPPYQSQIVC